MSGPVIDVDPGDLTPEEIRAFYVERFGDRCAAWLVNRFRGQVRRYGVFAMHLNAGDEEPPWLQIAIEYLKRRAPKWSVVVFSRRGERRYRVSWHGGRGPREIPQAIRPIS